MEVREPMWIEDGDRSIDLPPEKIEIVDRADVLVVGGGTAGVPAAIAAGRREADVVLVESNPFLGGTATGGKVHIYYYGVGGGLQAEIERKTLKLQEKFEIKSYGLHPECKKLVLQEMIRQAKVRTYLKTLAVGVIMEGNAVKGIIIESVSGRKAIMADVIVDATGDGDIAAMAGAEFKIGREADGFTQPYSLPPVRLEERGLRYVNFDAGWLDHSDIRDISKALLEARSHLWRDEGYGESDRYIEIAPMLGVRESRWVVGDYVLSLMDQIENRRFPDVIARCWANYDNHAVDYENESELAQIWVSILGLWGKEIGCDVPYRSLLPKGIENLIVACRAISADHDAQMALRMQKTMEVIGEAAGIAAALSAKQGIPPRQLDPKKIQAILVQSGVLEPTVLDEGHYMEQPASPKPGLNELIGKLAEEDNSETIWQITRYGDEAVPKLLKLLSSDESELRFSAALALGILKRPEAAPELRRALTEKHRELADPKAVPRRIAAAILLGMIGDREAVPELLRILSEPDIDPHSATFLIKALGRIGDPSCVDPIKEYVRSELPDIPVKLSGGVVRSSMRWSVDIAAGQVLMKFGDPMGEEIVRKYLNDPRSSVRRYARKVLEGKG